MTGENRRRNIRDELARAREAFRAAEALLDLDLRADSVSRSYYAVVHLMRALLLSLGLEAKTHAGLVHLFHGELIRPGAFPDTHNRAIAALQRSREFADYDSAVTFTKTEAQASLSDAQAFARDAHEFLRAKGLVEDERGS